MRAMEPIESERPKTKSARVSIRGRGRTPALDCCIDRLKNGSLFGLSEAQLS